MYCKNCGSPLPPGALFCRECGHQVFSENPSGPEEPLFRPKRHGLRRKIILCAAFLVGAICIVSFYASTPVYNTKSIVFDSYGDIPIGEAADQNLSAVKWASERNNDGSYTVTVRGISEKYSTRIGIDFNYSEDSDYCWANAEAAFANGSYFYDDLSIAAAMAMIYGDNDTVDAALLWSMLE